MSKPGHKLPACFGDLPTVEQVAAAPPRRTPRTTRRQLASFGASTRTAEGYPKRTKNGTAYISRLEWENEQALNTRSVTNSLRSSGHQPQPA